MNIPAKALGAAREALVKRGLLAVGDAAEIALEAAAPFIAAQAQVDALLEAASEMERLTEAVALVSSASKAEALWLTLAPHTTFLRAFAEGIRQ